MVQTQPVKVEDIINDGLVASTATAAYATNVVGVSTCGCRAIATIAMVLAIVAGGQLASFEEWKQILVLFINKNIFYS